MQHLIVSALVGTALTLPGLAENLIENGGFEMPRVTGRTPSGNADDRSLLLNVGVWSFFATNADSGGGKLEIGITDEISHSGKQSIYIDFNKVTAPGRQAVLKTNLIPVVAGKNFRVSIWGRIDRKRPLALDERRPFMWLQVQFFRSDRETPVGDPVGGPQLLPGNVVPGGPHELLFVSGKWKESFARLASPAEAAYARMTWSWTTPGDEGETDGVIYWDDATFEEDAVSKPIGAQRSSLENDRNDGAQHGQK